jgi:phosphopentomutase
MKNQKTGLFQLSRTVLLTRKKNVSRKPSPGHDVRRYAVMIKRVALFVLDSVGVGELPDAGDYGDSGSNTLGNISHAVGGLKMPNLGRLGLGNIIPVEGVPPVESPAASYGRMAEKSAGKDTTPATGKWPG